LFRARPKLREQLQCELQRLRGEALEIEQLLNESRVSEAV
jgi:hypothetical protein